MTKPNLWKINADIKQRAGGVEQGKQSINLNKRPIEINRILIAAGIIILILGIALIIISPSFIFFDHVPGKVLGVTVQMERTTDLRRVTMFFGVALLIIGGIISAVDFSRLSSTQSTTPPPPTTQPVVTHSVPPKSIGLGNTPYEAQSIMGQPDKIIDLGARVIHVYKDMKIIYDDGKVSDVQLS